MLHDIQNTQVLLLATVLFAACLAKLIVRRPVAAAAEQVHGVPWRVTALRQSRRVSVGLGLTEGTLALALLVTSHMSVRVATTVAFAAATWAVGELRVHRPDAGCGCFGGLSTERVRRRSVLRAMLFTAAAVLSLGAPLAGVEVLREVPAQVALVFAVELALFAALSPELSVLAGRGRLRRRPTTPCERRRSPLAETYTTLYESRAWLDAENSVSSAVPLDVWREGCWRFVVFPARLDGRDTELVFAVSTAERDRTVKAAHFPPASPTQAAPSAPQTTSTPTSTPAPPGAPAATKTRKSAAQGPLTTSDPPATTDPLHAGGASSAGAAIESLKVAAAEGVSPLSALEACPTALSTSL
ncbi:hypothetical protein GCM10010191_88430 [Actinomadura vinacea]|uniref:Methylamine utilisation protein MauE domain-containing protein n=1 Tax=Actinomadura vinacea TaxID=115336 RepID=A0ABN3KG33_9ACTN